MQYVLPFFVLIVFTGAISQVQRRRHQTSNLRHAIEFEKVVFRTRVHVKVRLATGDWSLKTLSGMELVVRDDAFQVTMIHSGIGGFLGSEWYFRAADSTIETTRWRILGVYPMAWIVIRDLGSRGGTSIAISTRYQLIEAWNALIRAGAQPLGLPPYS